MMTAKCCDCEKVRIEDKWIEREAFPQERFSYTYCTDCLRVFRRKMWRERLACRMALTVHSHAV